MRSLSRKIGHHSIDNYAQGVLGYLHNPPLPKAKILETNVCLATSQYRPMGSFLESHGNLLGPQSQFYLIGFKD